MDHYNQLYANKLDEMDKFQDRHNYKKEHKKEKKV